MAETDVITKSSVPPQPNQPAASLVEQKVELGVEERVVHIKVVGGIANGDYPSSDYQTAKRAWEAFVEAGIEPQFLVANGLSKGHNYQVSEISTRQLLKRRGVNSLTGESRVSEEALLAYNYTKSQADDSKALVVVGHELVLGNEEVVEATVILPDRQNKIPEPTSNILPEDS